MTADFKNYLFYNSNTRLEQARESGVSINDIFVSEDCLPTWPGCTWDPSTESLHDIIQSRLATREEAQQAGKLVREDIIWKTALKLDEARARGLALEDVHIGLNLLPV